MNWFKRLFKRCEHDWEFVRNIYGDEINYCNGDRSWWRCKKCGKLEHRRYLQESTVMQKLDKLYDEYYDNKYKDWQVLRADILTGMLQTMMTKAKNGECWADFVLACEEAHNDRNYYEKWFNDNKLKCEVELYNQKEKYDKLNKYQFKVRWKYKW